MYIPTRELDEFAKTIIIFRVGTQNQFFSELNKIVHDGLKPYTKVQNITLLCYQKREILTIYIANKSRSIHEND